MRSDKTDSSILGVPYDTVPLTFPQIRDQLAAETGNDKVTVPTLKTAGGFVTDSWEVAKYVSMPFACVSNISSRRTTPRPRAPSSTPPRRRCTTTRGS